MFACPFIWINTACATPLRSIWNSNASTGSYQDGETWQWLSTIIIAPLRLPLPPLESLELAVEFRQSNYEGAIVDWIQEAARDKALGIVINPAGYTTTSVAILDAILAVKIPVIEVHISNIHARESFRQHSYVSRAARAVICGFGIEGYALAIVGLAAMVGATAKS